MATCSRPWTRTCRRATEDHGARSEVRGADPDLIVKAASEAYPGLTANEYLCLRAATLAGIETPTFDFSHDGKLLVLERFDTVMKAASDERIARELLQGMRDMWPSGLEYGKRSTAH